MFSEFFKQVQISFITRSQKSLTQNKGNNCFDAYEFKFFHQWIDQDLIPFEGWVVYTLLRNKLQCPRPKKGKESFCFLLKLLESEKLSE